MRSPTYCAECGAPMYAMVRAHHHTEDGRDVTRGHATDDDGRECPRCGLIWCVLHHESAFFGRDLSRADANLDDRPLPAWRPVRYPATLDMPEWRRRALEDRDRFGYVARRDTTGTVRS